MSSTSTQKLPFFSLLGLVVGSMVGAGIFSLPATFGRSTGVLGAVIAWCIAGGGMLMLAFVFQNLAARKPELDSGVFVYAKEGFGDYMGFASGLGFWAGSCVGNTFYFILIKSTLGAFFPIFGDGNTVAAVGISSILLWSFHFMILRGVKEAAAINTIATVAKILPIVIFLVFVIFAFQSDIFSANILGYNVVENVSADLEHLGEYGYVGHSAMIMDAPAPAENLFTQIRGTMLATVFVFIGIEGASVYSRLAKRREDVGVATVLGFLGVLCLFVMITILSYGVMSRQELAGLRQPSMAGVLEHIVGHWGAVFISVGLIISVLGAFLSWTLLASEVLFSAAKSKSFPAVFAAENKNKVPAPALWMSNGMVQLILLLTMFTPYAFTLALELTSALSLIPYLFVAAYALKLAKTGESYEENTQSQRKDFIIAFLGTLYSVMMLYSGGLKYILLATLIYAPGSLLYIKARKEQGLAVFNNTTERMIFIAILAGSVIALYAIFTGLIEI